MLMFKKLERKVLKRNPILYGDFRSYEEAQKKSGTYENDEILEKVLKSTLKVISGEKVFERDGMSFDFSEYNYNLMCYLQKIYIEDEILNICDFGGALGSVFWQHRNCFFNNMNLSWNIVEQKQFVDCGMKNIFNNQLSFYYSVNDIKKNINCLLLSSVIQYFEDMDFVENVIKTLNSNYIIFERTPVSSRKRIMIEDVAEPIYNSRRPYVCNKEQDLIRMVEKNGYCLIDCWNSFVDPSIRVGIQKIELKSFVFKKKVY